MGPISEAEFRADLVARGIDQTLIDETIAAARAHWPGAMKTECDNDGCGGTLVFDARTRVPNTGAAFVDDDTNRGLEVTAPQTAPGWTCSGCGRFKWLS